MKKIVLIVNKYNYCTIIEILKNHKISFIEEQNFLSTKKNKSINLTSKNLIEIAHFNSIVDFKNYIMKEKNKNSIVIDAIFVDTSIEIHSLVMYAKVLIIPNISLNSNKDFNNFISYGFEPTSNVSYSSIMKKHNYDQLVICVQNSFKTLFNTPMIEFEFLIKTINLDLLSLNDFLGIIALCLFLDLRFEKNELINFEKENLYVKQ